MTALAHLPRTLTAIMAVGMLCVVVSQAANGAQTPAPPSAVPAGALERPIEIRARLVSGAAFVGKVSAWSKDGITGSFGNHAWTDLVTADMRRVYMQLMDRKNAEQWTSLGELLASARDGAQFADDAFAQAKRLGATPAAIEDARTRGKAAGIARKERERMDGERRLQDDVLPDDAIAKPWPVLTDAEQNSAIDTMRQQAIAAMTVAGVKYESVETDNFLVFGDISRSELLRWSRELDGVYARVSGILVVPKGVKLFWGKAVVLAFDKQDTFRLAEAAIFNHKAPAMLRGVCHMKGPQLFISIYRGNNELEFASTLVHETTHGIVYRYATPIQMPDWANEGFAECVARECVKNSNVDASRRPQGLAFFRQGGDATKIMALSGKDGTWPGDNAIGYSVGYIMVDLMIADRQQKFGSWVKAIKGGKPWQKALAEDFGVAAPALAASAAQWYRTNDGAPRRR